VFEEPTIDVSVIDTQPVKRLSREDTRDDRPHRVLTTPMPGLIGGAGVLRLSATDEDDQSELEPLRLELARLVRMLHAARSTEQSRTAASRALRFLFSDGLALDEEERRVLGLELTRARRRFNRLHQQRAATT
jgi:hypothetical protein